MSSTYHTTTETNKYEEGYGIFLRRSDFREKVLEEFETIVQGKFNSLVNMKVLDVGCGDGQMTKRYLDRIKQQQTNFDLTLVDPAQEALIGAKQLLEGVCSSIVCKTDLPETCEYNFIIASYVFYHLPASSLENMLNLLAPGGALALMMGTNDNPLKTHPKLKELSQHGSSDKLTPFLEQLKHSENCSVKRFPVSTHLDIKGLWKSENFTEEAKTYLRFALNRDFETMPDQGVSALREIFQNAFKSGLGKIRSVHEIIWIERKL